MRKTGEALSMRQTAAASVMAPTLYQHAHSPSPIFDHFRVAIPQTLAPLNLKDILNL